jgi:ATP/maltotriose-dependent transcriptional regulator MalT
VKPRTFVARQYVFLAMTHFRRGDTAAAKRQLDQARALAAAGGATAKDYAALLTEAEALVMNQPGKEQTFQQP